MPKSYCISYKKRDTSEEKRMKRFNCELFLTIMHKEKGLFVMQSGKIPPIRAFSVDRDNSVR